MRLEKKIMTISLHGESFLKADNVLIRDNVIITQKDIKICIGDLLTEILEYINEKNMAYKLLYANEGIQWVNKYFRKQLENKSKVPHEQLHCFFDDMVASSLKWLENLLFLFY